MLRVWEVLGSRWTLGAGGCAGSASTHARTAPARTWRLPESARVAVAWLLRHHSGREAFGRPLCGKAFAQPPTWTSTMRVHWSERPLECHRCLKALGKCAHLVRYSGAHVCARAWKGGHTPPGSGTRNMRTPASPWLVPLPAGTLGRTPSQAHPTPACSAGASSGAAQPSCSFVGCTPTNPVVLRGWGAAPANGVRMLIRGSGVDAAAWCNISETQGLGQEESFLQRPHYVPYLKYLLESLIMSVSELLRLFTLELNLRV